MDGRSNATVAGIVIPLLLSSSVFAELTISDIQVVDLGTLPGGNVSAARDINNVGQIVGWSDTATGETHAFVVTGAVKEDLGTLGGDSSLAFGINNLGLVVGRADNGAGVQHGFVWQDGVMTDLGAFPPEDDLGSNSSAYAINDNGFVTGNIDAAGVVWDLAGVPNFPPFPPFVRVTDPGPFSPAIGFDINNSDQVAGTLLSDAVGFLWLGGVLEPLVALDPVQDDDAFGINESGQVVGRGLLSAPLSYHAVFWPDPDTIIDLGTLGGVTSVANDINNAGFVVGSSETVTGETEAFVWHVDLGMQSLGTLGGSNSEAHAINATGRIVGSSEAEDGTMRATMWTVAYGLCDPETPGAIIGTSGDDHLIGTSGDDVIMGLEGDDSIVGQGGNDCIAGGAGADRIIGGSGNDKLDGGSGNDKIIGAGGDDRILAGAGNDAVVAGAGNDVVNGGQGDDRIMGGSGNDELDGGASSDLIIGGQGTDTCVNGELAIQCE